MSVFAWNSKYSVNVKEIDDQHKKLINMVTQLNEAMRQGKGKQILEKLLQDLVQYTRTHFAAEERLMKTHGYPEFEEHKAKHDKMTQKVLEVQKSFKDGKTSITIEVMDFLEKWVDQHIMVTDKKYAPFLNGKGVS
ncbi:MAG: bacteriohemerythrin [Syntrophobacteraceae bacterium]